MDKLVYKIKADKILKRLIKALRDRKDGVAWAKDRVVLHENSQIQHKLTHG